MSNRLPSIMDELARKDSNIVSDRVAELREIDLLLKYTLARKYVRLRQENRRLVQRHTDIYWLLERGHYMTALELLRKAL